jgi:hypothetical protein
MGGIDCSSHGTSSPLLIVFAGTDFLDLQVLKSQQGRDDSVRDLLSTIVDMLGFVKDVEGLQKMQKIQETVSSMMKGILDCALFVQEYSGKGLFGEYCHSFDDRKI